MQAGVIGDLVVMTLGTTVDVSSHFTRSAMDNAPSGMSHVRGQLPRCRKSIEMLSEQSLHVDRHQTHLIKFTTPTLLKRKNSERSSTLFYFVAGMDASHLPAGMRPASYPERAKVCIGAIRYHSTRDAKSTLNR
jgi:hypothetical protein